MATIQCPQGHVYDDSKYPACPSCPVVKDVRVNKTIANNPPGGTPKPGGGSSSEGLTVAMTSGGDVDPVVGWLVAITGVNRGRDYRLHGEANKIGRSPAMDVCIEGDQTISRDTHCLIVYSPRNKRFSIVPGTGRNLVYIDGEELLAAKPLAAYQKIELGQGTFLFMPFCSEQFDWSQADPAPPAQTAEPKPRDGTPSGPESIG